MAGGLCGVVQQTHRERGGLARDGDESEGENVEMAGSGGKWLGFLPRSATASHRALQQAPGGHAGSIQP